MSGLGTKGVILVGCQALIVAKENAEAALALSPPGALREALEGVARAADIGLKTVEAALAQVKASKPAEPR